MIVIHLGRKDTAGQGKQGAQLRPGFLKQYISIPAELALTQDTQYDVCDTTYYMVLYDKPYMQADETEQNDTEQQATSGN